ncbi:MAG: pyrimidine 5'-nucleotidase [Pseudomonadota bacterium]
MNFLKQYEWILFDADETLFQFDAFAGLKLMFSRFDVNFTESDYHEYQLLNTALWIDYQNNQITVHALKCRRFDLWSKKLNIPAEHLNSAFMSAMVEICIPLDGAVNLLKSLHGHVKLGIVTNGFTELQQERLVRTGLKHHFEFVVTSEEVGIAKPHAGIFDYALSIMGHPARDRVLMVGDNPDSDILGGMNAELHTCWLNIHARELPPYITPHHQVTSLGELERWLCDSHYA